MAHHTGATAPGGVGTRTKIQAFEWARWGSNPRPNGYEPSALTTELRALDSRAIVSPASPRHATPVGPSLPNHACTSISSCHARVRTLRSEAGPAHGGHDGQSRKAPRAAASSRAPSRGLGRAGHSRGARRSQELGVAVDPRRRDPRHHPSETAQAAKAQPEQASTTQATAGLASPTPTRRSSHFSAVAAALLRDRRVPPARGPPPPHRLRSRRRDDALVTPHRRALHAVRQALPDTR